MPHKLLFHFWPIPQKNLCYQGIPSVNSQDSDHLLLIIVLFLTIFISGFSLLYLSALSIRLKIILVMCILSAYIRCAEEPSSVTISPSLFSTCSLILAIVWSISL